MNFEKQQPPQLDVISQGILAQKPLHFACYTGDGHLLDTLIGRALLYNNNNNNEEGLNTSVASLISEEDSLNGWTPAHWAAFYGQLSCLMKLHIKPGLGFDTPSHRSNTSPLHLAAQSGAVLCLKWLLQCGSSQNRQDFMGETPLHKAAKAGNMDCVAMLIGHGASLDLKNHRGMTPAEIAEQSNHTALAQYIRRAAEQAEYGGITKCHTPPLLISDLGVGSEVSPKPPAPTHFYSAHPKFPDMAFMSKELQGALASYIVMNGEAIHNTDMYKTLSEESCDMDQDNTDMDEMVCNSNNNINNTRCADSLQLSQPCAGLKRSFDADEDDEWHLHKRRCFVSASEKSHEERYGDAHNNNIISSYNAVLAMRVEPMSQSSYTESSSVLSKPSSPELPHSSQMDHQASLAAQQGYDSTFMTTITSAFH